MQFRPGVLLKMFRDARQQSLSLRWKLAVWLIMLGCTLVVLVFFVFNLIGIVNPIERQIETMLFNQLDRTVSDIRHDTDDLAAWGISLSDQLSDTVADILQERRLSFDDLRNNPDPVSYTHLKQIFAIVKCSFKFCTSPYFWKNKGIFVFNSFIAFADKFMPSIL